MSAEDGNDTTSVVIEMPIEQAASFTNALDPYINELETAKANLQELNIGNHPSITKIENEIEELQKTKRTLRNALNGQTNSKNNQQKTQNKNQTQQNNKGKNTQQEEQKNKETTTQKKSQNNKQKINKDINTELDTDQQIKELLYINRDKPISPGVITKIVNDEPMEIMQTLSELTTKGYITESEKRNTYLGTEKLYAQFE